MNDHLSRDQSSRLAGLMREQLNEMMTAAHELGDIVSMSEKGQDYLALINRGLYRQLRLTRHLELLHLLTSEDEIRLNLRPAELVSLCRDLMAQVESVLRVRDLRVTFHTTLDSLITSADRVRIEDMLLCLISNSVHAVKEGGAIDLTLEQRGGRVLFLLTDNGGGVSDAVMAEFFECADAEDEGPAEVTMKLGLPLARKIAVLHGGFVIADNYAGKGVRLAVILPVQDVEAQHGRLRAPAPELNESGWNRVLVELSDALPARSFLPKELDG